MKTVFRHNNTDYPIVIEKKLQCCHIKINDVESEVELIHHDNFMILFKINGKIHKSYCAKNSHVWYIQVDGEFHSTEEMTEYRSTIQQSIDLQSTIDTDVRSPMPGKVQRLEVTKGEEITKGQRLCVVEAMKMEHVIYAACQGVIRAINCNVGEVINTGQILIEIIKHPGDETT
jgi:biotin carboxyl carrier protein